MFNKYKLTFSITLILAYSVLIILYCFISPTIIPEGVLPGFIDLRAVTESCDCINQGYNPYFVKNEYCHWVYNYPKLWIDIFNFFGMTGDVTLTVGFSMIILFTLTIICLFEFNSYFQVIVGLFISLSPPVLLLLERGNIDIFIFSFLFFFVYFLRKIKENNFTIHTSYLVIIFCTILKIYPFFFLSLIIIDRISNKNKLLIIIYSLLILGVYFSMHLNDTIIEIKNTPKPSELAYGKNVWFQEFVSNPLLRYVSFIPTITVLFFFYLKRNWFFELFKLFNYNTLSFKLFFATSVLFLGSYLFGNNWDYRLSFLLFLIPFIFELPVTDKKVKIFKCIFYILLCIVYYSSYIHRSGYFFYNYKQWFIGRNTLMILKYLATTIFACFSIFSLYFYVFNFYIKRKHFN